MIEAAVIALRLLQYAGAVVLFGSSLFFLYALPANGPGSVSMTRWARPLVAGSAAVLAVAALLAIGAQASLFTGSFAEGFQRESIEAVVGSMDVGKAGVVRAAAATAAAGVVLIGSARANWLVACGLGGIATVSLAWMGHGAATDGVAGWVHLASDVFHVLAAAVWLGALVGFLLWLLSARSPSDRAALHEALRRFSGMGSLLVAVLIVTGLVNGWVLVGPDRAVTLLTTPYGLLLALKLLLFVAMLALAAVNRFRLTPALGLRADGAIAALRRSVSLETAAGFAVLLLVAWLGTLSQAGSA